MTVSQQRNGSPWRRPSRSWRRSRVALSVVAASLTAALVAGCGGGGGSSAASNGNGLTPDQLSSALTASMKKFNVSASQLGDLAAQLTVPQEWIDGAKKEGTVIIQSDQHPDVTDKMKAAFEARYPYIKANFVYGSTSDNRSAQALTAFKQGKSITDLVGGITQTMQDFIAAGALEKVNGLPVWKDIPDSSKDPQGWWIAYATKFWSIGYNTEKVKESDLPKTWQDFIATPRFKQGDFAITFKPELFVYALAAQYGVPWAQQFSKDLFALHPQERNEGQGALPQLLANGTFSIVVPAASYAIKDLADQGAPVAWYTPQPPVSNPTDLEIMSNAAHKNAARIFLNWLASSEGQIIASDVQGISPVNDQLTSIAALYPYPEQVANKQWLSVPPDKKNEIADQIDPIWDQNWTNKKK